MGRGTAHLRKASGCTSCISLVDDSWYLVVLGTPWYFLNFPTPPHTVSAYNLLDGFRKAVLERLGTAAFSGPLESTTVNVKEPRTSKVVGATPALHIHLQSSLRGESGADPMCLSDFLHTVLRSNPGMKFAAIKLPRDADAITTAVSEVSEANGVNEQWWVREQPDGSLALSATKPTSKQVTVLEPHIPT